MALVCLAACAPLVPPTLPPATSLPALAVTAVPLPTATALTIPSPIATALTIPSPVATATAPRASPIPSPASIRVTSPFAPLPPLHTVISAGTATQVSLLAEWGKGPIQGMRYSPDGTTIAVDSSIGLYLYDAQSLGQKSFIRLNPPSAIVALSPDLSTLASAANNSVMLFRAGGDDGMQRRQRSEGTRYADGCG